MRDERGAAEHPQLAGRGFRIAPRIRRRNQSDLRSVSGQAGHRMPKQEPSAVDQWPGRLGRDEQDLHAPRRPQRAATWSGSRMRGKISRANLRKVNDAARIPFQQLYNAPERDLMKVN
jgi:hypothetical protein